MHKHLSGLIGLALVTALAGCGTPRHTNTLIFGTNTKVAFDVGPDPTGLVSVTLGYKRQEAVWMPLLANKGTNLEPQDCKENCLYKGKEGTSSEPAEDTYSVLASFGADFSGEAESAKAKGAVGIAQYFATGLAARYLAKEGGAQLVSVQPDAAVKQKAQEIISAETLGLARVLAYVNNGGDVDAAKLTALTQNTGLDANWVGAYGGNPVSKLRDELDGPSRALIVKMAANIPEK